MKQISNLNEATRALMQFAPKSASKGAYTLERMRALMQLLDNPQDKLKIIHVAGTSGKTSTSYYAAALLRAAGQKVGLTVSPHVTAVNERVQINLIPLPEAEFCNELNNFLKLIEDSGIKPSYFELLIAFAYWEFARQAVDYAVVEVGLGGLLDGTNVISRTDKVCVITDIGLDHINVLGKTLADIAAQKAGIIQSHNEVFTYRQSEEISNAIKKQCDKQQATLHYVESGENIPGLDFLPLFQQHNFPLAKAAVEHLLERDKLQPLSDHQIMAAAKTHIPARMEIFSHGGKTVILDGAHNQQKLHALVESIKVRFAAQTAAAIVSFAAGDEYRLDGALQEVISLCRHIIITSFSGEQDTPKVSVDPHTISDLLDRQNFHSYEIIPVPEQALDTLMSRYEPVLLVTGSFYLLNHIRPLMLEQYD